MTPKLRRRLFESQAGICAYCKQLTPYHKWTIDHKLPRSRGGIGINMNKVGCCNNCNQKKGNLTVEEFLQFGQRERQKMKKLQTAIQFSLKSDSLKASGTLQGL